MSAGVTCPICNEQVASARGLAAHQRGFRCMAARARTKAIADGLGRADRFDLDVLGLTCDYRPTSRDRTAPTECWTEAWIAGILGWIGVGRRVRRAAVGHVLREPSLLLRVPVCPPNTFFFPEGRMHIWLDRARGNSGHLNIPLPSPDVRPVIAGRAAGPNYDTWDVTFDDDGYIAFPYAEVLPPMFVVMQAQSATMAWAACNAAVYALAAGETLW
jgi:hypothetical protein